jgi:hypothetical protein
MGERGRELVKSRFSAAAFRERWRRLVLEELAGSRSEALEPAAGTTEQVRRVEEKA